MYYNSVNVLSCDVVKVITESIINSKYKLGMGFEVS